MPGSRPGHALLTWRPWSWRDRALSDRALSRRASPCSARAATSAPAQGPGHGLTGQSQRQAGQQAKSCSTPPPSWLERAVGERPRCATLHLMSSPCFRHPVRGRAAPRIFEALHYCCVAFCSDWLLVSAATATSQHGATSLVPCCICHEGSSQSTRRPWSGADCVPV